MDINQIREKLTQAISSSTDWIDKLNDTDPGHYGIEDWDVHISSNDIWVDIPTRTFKFKNVKFDFQLTLGSSHDGISVKFNRDAAGSGCFDFDNGNKIKIIEPIKIDVDLDLYNELRK